MSIAISAEARDGKANESLIEFLSECLKCKKRQVEIIVGGTSRSKVIQIEGLTADQVQQLLSESLRQA